MTNTNERRKVDLEEREKRPVSSHPRKPGGGGSADLKEGQRKTLKKGLSRHTKGGGEEGQEGDRA